MAIRLEGSFATVVHQVPPRARLESTFATVVHQVPPRGRLEATFATVVHESGDIYSGDPDPPPDSCGPPTTQSVPEVCDKPTAAQLLPRRAVPLTLVLPSVAAAAFVLPIVAEPASLSSPTVRWEDGPLAARSFGGQELTDQYGTLPSDADGNYLDPYTGERLAIDEGYTAGASVGNHRIYGDLTATVAGSIASRRRSGFDQLSVTASASGGYAFFSLQGMAQTFIARVEQQTDPGIENIWFGVDPEDNRWGLQVLGKNSFEVRFFEDATLRTNAAVNSAAAYGAGKTYTVGGSANSDGDTSITTWDVGGVQIGTNAANWPGGVVSLEGVYALGRARSDAGGGFSSGDVPAFVVWDGSVQNAATLANVEADLRAGTDIDTIKSTYAASVASDGVIAGVYSRVEPTELFALSGSGELPRLVVVETEPTTYTQPSDFASLVGDWDAYRGASYNGSSQLEGIKDYGPNGYDMTVSVPEHTSQTCQVLGRSVTLPGGGSDTVDNYGGYLLTGTLNDFTVALIIPTLWLAAGHEQDTYFSLDATVGDENLRVQTDATENTLLVLDHLGGTVASVPIGFASGNGSAANAIVVIRRDTTAGEVYVDCWYDQDTGAGTQKPAKVTASDATLRASFALNGVALGGRYGAATNHWTGLLHRAALFNTALSDAETLALAQGFAARLGLTSVT